MLMDLAPQVAFQKKRRQCCIMERPPARVRRAPVRQLTRPVDQPVLFNPDPSQREPRRGVHDQRSKHRVPLRGVPHMVRVPGRLIRPMRSQTKAAHHGLSAEMSGFHRVQHAANALVQAGPLDAHGAAPHQFRGSVRVKRFLKPPGFPGRLPAVLQPGPRQAVPAGHLSRDLIDAPRTTVTTLDLLDITSIPFSTVGVHMICKLLRMCEDLRTHILIDWIDVAKTDERAVAPRRAMLRPDANARSKSTPCS
ncbi:hypothetical protein MTO96_013800 [Rhipicephalus appendiculatus]